MTLILRPAQAADLPAASALCLRSKAYWGYDVKFMAACAVELTLVESQLAVDPVILAEDSRGLAGVAHVILDKDGCYLDKLFIDIDRMGLGYGKILYDWPVNASRSLGVSEMIIAADPGAAPFYKKMGAKLAGEILSESIAGRVLPRFVQPL